EEIKKAAKSVLLSSHIFGEVERLADRVVIIRQGEIVEAGRIDELPQLTRSTVATATQRDVRKMVEAEEELNYEQKDNEATVSADHQQLNDILSAASKLGVKKFESTPPILEDLFTRHYEG